MADEQKNPAQSDADGHGKEQEIFEQRLQKAAKWKELGANPFGNGYAPKNLAKQIHDAHGNQTDEQIQSAGAPTYDVAGRIIALRTFGKAAFVKIRDRSGEIQLHVKLDLLKERYEL